MVLGSGRRIQDDKHVDSIQQFLEPLQNISPLESSQFPKAKSPREARAPARLLLSRPGGFDMSGDLKLLKILGKHACQIGRSLVVCGFIFP